MFISGSLIRILLLLTLVFCAKCLTAAQLVQRVAPKGTVYPGGSSYNANVNYPIYYGDAPNYTGPASPFNVANYATFINFVPTSFGNYDTSSSCAYPSTGETYKVFYALDGYNLYLRLNGSSPQRPVDSSNPNLYGADSQGNVLVCAYGNPPPAAVLSQNVPNAPATIAEIAGSADGAWLYAITGFITPAKDPFPYNNVTNCLLTNCSSSLYATAIDSSYKATGWSIVATHTSDLTEIGYDINGNVYVKDSNGIYYSVTPTPPASPPPSAIELTTSTPGGVIGAATTGAVSGATEDADGGSGGAVEEFRFSLTPERIKLGIGNMVGAYNLAKSNTHSRTLAALESALGSAKAMQKVSNDVTVWASGVYAQGQLKPMIGNPAAKDKHYGIMMGSHYYHKPTAQLIGLAFDIGLGTSQVNIDHELNNSYRSAQATLYYGLGLANNWRLNVHGAFMTINSSHNRPYTPRGSTKRNIASSRGRSQVMSGMVEVAHKFKPVSYFHLKTSLGGNYSHTKQFAYSEKDAGTNNISYAAASMNEANIKFGLKASLFHEPNEQKIYGLYPFLNYTRYVKMGSMQQRITTINSGQVQMLQAGTAGRNLLSMGIGAGIIDKEANTKVQLGYTANFQKYRKSQEVIVKGSVEF